MTGLVHWFLLRTLLDLHGADQVADQLLHLVVPILAVAGLAGLRPPPAHRLGRSASGDGVAGRLARGDAAPAAVTGWYPYPFLDHGTHGWDHVAVVCVGIFVLFFAVFAGMREYDRRVRPAPVTGS